MDERTKWGGEVILSLDPSSTCIGYARFSRDGDLHDAGRITSKKSQRATVRMVKLAEEIVELVECSTPASRIICVVEIPSGHVNRGRHGGGGAGLSTYGLAVGYLLGRLASLDVDVRMVEENKWTRGIPKFKRCRLVALKHQSYQPINDPGGDVADAIGLGEWWIMEQKLSPAPRPEAHAAIGGQP